MDYEKVISDALPFVQQGLEIIKDKAIDEVSKGGVKLFFEWLKSIFIKPSAKAKIDATLVEPNETNIKGIESLLKDAIIDKELEIEELNKRFIELQDNVIKLQPENKISIRNSKNVVIGPVSVGVGNINIGDNSK